MNQSFTDQNLNFITEMLSSGKILRDYPDKVSSDIVIYEPASLPFGGQYNGLDEFDAFYPKVREYYDFDSFDIVDIHASKNVVFATVNVTVKTTGQSLTVCERFEFDGTLLVKIQAFMLDYTQ